MLELAILLGLIISAVYYVVSPYIHAAAPQDLDNQIKNLGGVSQAELIQQLEAEISRYQAKSSQAEQLICPQCGYHRAVNDKFCSNCGIKLI